MGTGGVFDSTLGGAVGIAKLRDVAEPGGK
jgi:hypothetical protein